MQNKNTITRYYGDNGQLLRYTIQPTAHNRARITKEMATRALRYKKQNTRAIIIDTIQRATIILAATALLVAVYLINN